MRKLKRGSKIQRILIVVLASVFLIELLLVGTQITGNPIKKVLDSVVGSSQVKTINNPDKIILIEIVGSDNKISVTKETQIYLIEIVGSGNIFNLCKNHSPEIDETGSNNVINYLNC